VRWPSGTVQEFRDVTADRHYVVDEAGGLRLEDRGGEGPRSSSTAGGATGADQ
jgi:hypothetical protein